MGKRLGDAVFDNAVEEIDFSKFTAQNATINANLVWQVESGLKGVFIPVTGKRGWAYKIGNAHWPGTNSWYRRFAFLTSNSYTNGGNPSFCDGTSRINVNSAGDEYQWSEGTIPSDANYMYVYIGSSAGDFIPDLFFIDPNPTSRIERLEDLTDGADDIKEGWFAVDGEPYQLEIEKNLVAKQQTIGRNGTNYAGIFYTGSNAELSFLVPKVPDNVTGGTVYSPSVSECFSVDSLPNKQLAIKFNQTTPARWVVYVVMYNASLVYLKHSASLYLSTENNWQGTFDLANEPNAKYFKIQFYHQTTAGTSDNALNVTLQDNLMEITQQDPSQESMPDRVAALEEKVANVVKDTIRILQYNIGHFAMGMNSSTYIGVDNITTQTYPQFFDYDTQLKRWKSKIQNVAADVMFFEEYSETFGSKNGSNVSTVNSGILNGYDYVDVSKNTDLGLSPTTGYWIHALISKYPLVSAYNVVLTPSGHNTYAAHMRVATININGIAVKVAVTHLHPGSDDTNYGIRTAEIKTIIKHFQNDDHVIVCGDFNTDKYTKVASADNVGDYHAGAAEFDPFLYGFEEDGVTYEGGYTAANHGVLGDMPTYVATGSRPDRDNWPQVPCCYLDNVLTKGFRMSNILVIDDGNLTDHCGIMCDLTIIE